MIYKRTIQRSLLAIVLFVVQKLWQKGMNTNIGKQFDGRSEHAVNKNTKYLASASLTERISQYIDSIHVIKSANGKE